MLFLLSILALTVTTSPVAGLGVLDTCSTDPSGCPQHSDCSDIFDVPRCICHTGYQPSDDTLSCLRVVQLGKDCTDPSTRCRGNVGLNGATCIDGICQCPAGFRAATDGIRCEPMSEFEGRVALLGQRCGAHRPCWDSVTQECMGRCTCKNGFVEARDSDLAIISFARECVPHQMHMLR